MYRRAFRLSPELRRRRESAKGAAATVISGGAVFVGVLFLFSLVLTKLDLSDGIVRAMSIVALCAGCYTVSFSAANRRRQRGLVTGIVCGLLVFALVFFVSVIVLKTLSGAGFITKLVMIVACSAAGGIAGVNSERR